MSGNSIVPDVIFFACFTLLISLIINSLKKKLRVPATIMMLISGILLRYVTKFLPSSLDTYELADHIDQNFLLFVFIPPLLFETALSLEWHVFKRQFFIIMLLATTGVIISTILTASAAALVYIDHSYSTSAFLIFGVVMSATDHVSVVAQFKELHVENRLSTLIQGETLFNDVTVLVLLYVFSDPYYSEVDIIQLGIQHFLQLTFGGLAIGGAMAICMTIWLRNIINEPIQEVTVTIVTAYLAFYFADGTGLHFSGAIAVGTVGLAMSAFGKTVVSPMSEHAMHTVWSLMGGNIESYIFLISGMIFAKVVLIEDRVAWNDYLRYIAIFLLCYICRAITMAIHYPLLKRLGYGLSLKELATLSFSGLKGSITIILALLVYSGDMLENDDESKFIMIGSMIITILSIITDSFLLSKIITIFEVVKISAVQENLLVQVTSALVHETYEELERLIESDDAKLSDWALVHEVAGSKKLINSLFSSSKIGREILKKNQDSENQSELELIKAFSDLVMLKPEQILTEIRRRFLMMMKGVFWHTFEEGQCFRLSLLQCSKATNYSLDREGEPLDTWKELLRISMPKLYMRTLQFGSKIPGLKKISRRLLCERLALTYDSALCFIHAHHEAVHFLKSMDTYFEGYQHHINTIIEESHHEVEACNHYIMDHITCNYPEELRYVQTYKSCHSVLNVQRRLIEKLMHHGMINETEYDKLATVLDERFKHLVFRYVPKIPDTLEMLSRVFPNLSDEVLERLASTASEVFFSEGDFLFVKGQAVQGVYIILKGCSREFSEDFEEKQTIGCTSGTQHMIPSFKFNITSSQAVTPTFALKIQPNMLEMGPDFGKEFWLKAATKIFMIFKHIFGALLDGISDENISKFTLSCKYAIYNTGDTVNCISGGLLLDGRLDSFEAYHYIPPDNYHTLNCERDTVFLHLPSIRSHEAKQEGTKKDFVRRTMMLLPNPVSTVPYFPGEKSKISTQSYAFERIERSNKKALVGRYLENQVDPDLRSNLLKYTAIND